MDIIKKEKVCTEAEFYDAVNRVYSVAESWTNGRNNFPNKEKILNFASHHRGLAFYVLTSLIKQRVIDATPEQLPDSLVIYAADIHMKGEDKKTYLQEIYLSKLAEELAGEILDKSILVKDVKCFRREIGARIHLIIHFY